MGKTKCLVAFYSRTGTTRKVASAISKTLKCDMEEIVDTKNRSGVLGYLGAGRDAAMKKLTEIEKTKHNPALYKLVIIGTPVWAQTMSSPIRTYITKNREHFKGAKMAFFCTMYGTGSKNTFADMEELCGKTPIGVLELTTKEVQNEEFVNKVNGVVGKIASRKAASP